MLTRLDGPLGSRLQAAGHDVSPPAWSARVLRAAPEAISAIHREYAAAGCEVHRANTFRCTFRACGDDWETLAHRAIDLARAEAKPGQRVAGSVGPLEDCYRPDLAPQLTRQEHFEQVRAFAGDVDLLFCETFPSLVEAREAVEACVATGKETWVSFTAGPDGKLLSPKRVAAGARDCVAVGAKAVLVNCIAAELTLPYVEALAEAGVPFGTYANAATWEGSACTPERYGELSRQWRAAGATIIGGCCGTTVEHLRAAFSES